MILPVLSNIAQYYFDFFIYENLTHIIRLRIILIISSHHMFLIYYHKTLSKYFQTGPNTYIYIYIIYLHYDYQALNPMLIYLLLKHIGSLICEKGVKLILYTNLLVLFVSNAWTK